MNTTIIRKTIVVLSLLLLLPCGPSRAADDTTYMPFVLASISDAPVSEEAAAVVTRLEAAGFSLAGEYAPLENARVIVVTSPELQSIAANTDRGGYGAAQRVSVSEREGKTEVAFVNPLYLQHAYHLEGDMQGVHDRLVAALGAISRFGAKNGLTAKKLANYHYMIGMQRFDDPSELGEFESHQAAVEAVQNGLAVEGDALTQIYRIDLPGSQQTVFGVSMRAVDQDDMDIDESHQLSIVDFEGHSKVAYFPYEILVTGPRVEALHMRFRMAVHFPDLSMMGKHGFMKLVSAPGATEDAMEAMLGKR
jgi:hypothetical protein